VRIQILVFDGFDELDVIGPLEVFRRAEAAGAEVEVELATIARSDEIVSQHGLRIHPDSILSQDADLVIVPGGGWIARSPKGAWAEANKGDIPNAIAKLHSNGKTIASVCTGAMLLAKAGLLRGRRAVTHHRAIAELKREGANIAHARVVDGGDLVTSGGVTSGLDLSLWLVKRYFGSKLADSIEEGLEYRRRGRVLKENVRRGRGETTKPKAAK
jgi:transcriptional regulator GlxA family with amidase domain